jgi:N-acetyl-gamma-glutamyl-phosphate reductase
VRHNNLRTYKPLDHQHIPEIVQTLTDAGAVDLTLRFVPVSAPLSRGIFATAFAHVDEGIGPDAIRALYAEAFAREPFVRVPRKRLPEVVAVKGTNYAEVAVAPGDVHDHKRAVASFAVTDNLIKGGAGQAIQSMNLMLGLDERLTLEDPGGWP